MAAAPFAEDTPQSPFELVREARVVIRSYYVGPQLDVKRICAHVYRDSPRQIKSGIAIVRLDGTSGGETSFAANNPQRPHKQNQPQNPQNTSSIPTVMTDAVLASEFKGPFGPLRRFVVLFPYGSAVFFNATESQIRYCLNRARLYTPAPIAAPTTDDYSLLVRPNAAEWFVQHPDSMELREFSVNSIRVISQVLAQTVAMDHYEQKVDTMLDRFRSLNARLEAEGALSMDKTKLFKLIASNNAILTDMITQLKLLDRSDTAWRYGRYDEMWTSLREDFEVSERFSTLEFKLTHVQHNTKFFLEVLHNKKSDLLEWIIIVLLAFEIVLCTYEIILATEDRRKNSSDGDDSNDDNESEEHQGKAIIVKEQKSVQ
eukprot:TRINITY_DN65989_c5_g14_i1.p1 TRINITY_DN65989_c5_g14~~TRINITY_DN65989_c5_g14_i1.p1  ORF type:complete len:436 (-),score=171.98 TRINITY_DN65989_c5_g14_i1:46-1164(-)